MILPVSSNCVSTLRRETESGRKESCGEQRSYLSDGFLYISKFQEKVIIGRNGKRSGC